MRDLDVLAVPRRVPAIMLDVRGGREEFVVAEDNWLWAHRTHLSFRRERTIGEHPTRSGYTRLLTLDCSHPLLPLLTRLLSHQIGTTLSPERVNRTLKMKTAL